jgi:hypothetical protein
MALSQRVPSCVMSGAVDDEQGSAIGNGQVEERRK